MKTLNLVAPVPFIDYDASWYAVASLATYVQDVVEVILTEKPIEADFIGISCPYIKHSARYAHAINTALNLSDNVHIGGMVATRAPEVLMQYIGQKKRVTILKGYGEIGVREIVTEQPVSGLEPEFCPKVDRKFLAKFYEESREGYAGRFASILTTRQCGHTCPFCSQLTDSRRVLLMPAPMVVKDFRELVEVYDVKQVGVFDDNFWVSKQRIKDIIDEVQKIGLEMPKLDIAMRASKIKESTISMMKQLNVSSVVIGAEAATDEVMKKLKPGVKIADLERTFEMLPESGIKVVAGFIIGHPWETEANLEALIELIQKYSSDTEVMVNVATAIPYPGTKFEEMEREAGFDPSKTWFSEQVALPEEPYMRTCTVESDAYTELVHGLAVAEKLCNSTCSWEQ